MNDSRSSQPPPLDVNGSAALERLGDRPSSAPLAPFAATGGPNPALAYHASVAPGSRAAVRSVLCRLASRLMGRKVPWQEATAVPWWDLRHAHVQALRAWLAEGNAPRTVNRDLSVLRGVLTMAWNNDQMPTDAYQKAMHVKGVEKSTEKVGRALTNGEVTTLLNTCEQMEARQGAMYAAVVAIMFSGGLRRIEVALLDRADVAPGGASLSVLGKRNKRRTVFLPEGAARRVEAWLALRGDEPGPLFLRKRGSRHSPNTVGAIVAEVRDLAGVDRFTPHDLRRSYGTHHLAEGTDLALLKDMMGHTDIRTTAIYDRRGEGAQAEAAKRVDVGDVPEAPTPAAAPPQAPRPEGYTLEDIFATGPWGDRDEVTRGALLRELLDKNVTCDRIDLTEREYRPEEYLAFSGGEREHKILCVQAADYIRSRGWTPVAGPQEALRYHGGIADVAERGGRLYVECGYTQVRKILRGLADGKEMLVVPYLGTVPTLGFLFKAVRPTAGAVELAKHRADPVRYGAAGALNRKDK